MRNFQTGLILLAATLLVLGTPPLLASVPQPAPVAATAPIALQLAASTEAPQCTLQDLGGRAVDPRHLGLPPELTAPQPVQLACNCFACFTQCGSCGVNQCLADPCDCHCLKCAIE